MLHGTTVIEWADEPGTRYCGRLFSVLGATVIRIASTAATPTPYDRWLDEGKHPAATFDGALRNLDHKVDLVLAGQTPQRIRETDAAIAKHNLDTVRAGLTWFGMSGPYADWHGDDALMQALTGIAFGFGPIEGPPTLPQGRGPQIIGGTTLAIGALAALRSRKRQATPRTVDVNIYEATLCLTDVGAAGAYQTPTVSTRLGVNRFAPNHPFGTYKTADGWLGVTALTPAQWQSFCDLIAKPEWKTDERLATSPLRVLHADLIDEALLQILPTRTADAWLAAGQALRIPFAPVPTPSEIVKTEHWLKRGNLAQLPGDPNVLAPRLPFRTAFDGHTRAETKPTGSAPLAGIRVIDFTMGWAGPLATRHLGDLGADVIKIESHTHMDWWRGWDAQAPADPPLHECMPNFNATNRSKRGIAIDLTTADGVAKAKALIANADVVVENYAPGVMHKLGLGPEALLRLRPGLVMLSMGAFGAIGPWSHFRAYGSTVEHSSGFPHVNGHADWPPAMQHVAYGDPIAGVYGAFAVLSALAAREREGGAWLDLSQVECLFQLNADAIIAAQIEGDPPRLGSRSTRIAPRCVIPCAGDESIAIAVTDLTAWRGLCDVLGRDDWVMDDALDTVAGRNARAYEIESALRAWARELTAADAAAQLQASDVAAAPIVPGHDLPEQPHLTATGVWAFLDRRHIGRHMMIAPPYIMDRHRIELTRAAPTVGEHTEEVLGS
jgi:crotonobetainyl-CoA:carnitine CoA-transferase CaiB-like acyl-CoA transferase